MGREGVGSDLAGEGRGCREAGKEENMEAGEKKDKEASQKGNE